jgi:hypothetical protein
MAIFHINSTFNEALHRQDEISRMQQSMKVIRTMLERRIRAAGAGTTYRTASSCGGLHQVGPFIIHNSNSLTAQDLTAGDADTDPDWFEVISADMSRNGQLTANTAAMAAQYPVVNGTVFRAGDLIGVSNKDGMCLRMATGSSANQVDVASSGTGAAAMAACYNNAANNATCQTGTLLAATLSAGATIANFGSGSFAMRVDNTNPDRPMLMMATSTAGGTPATYQWQPVAGNVEDMQIAAHVDTSATPDEIGDVWVNSRDLTAAEINRVRAVRITLVFRSTTAITGFNLGRRPALEDRAAATVDDGYVRRVLSMVISLRNKLMPET